MKTTGIVGVFVAFAAGFGGTSFLAAQGELDRLESGIRTANGPPALAVAAPPRVYLGAVADNDAGRGVIVLSVRSGGPADRAGLQAQDLIVGAAGRKIRLLAELSTILNSLNPGDRLVLEYLRGNRPLRAEVILAAPAAAAQKGTPAVPPPSGPGAGRTESIPPPPGEMAPAKPPEGPALAVPGNPFKPNPPSGPQAQIEELRRRVDQLERRVEELERALAESKRK